MKGGWHRGGDDVISLFRARLPIDPDELEWQLATFKWLCSEFGPVTRKELVLPLPEIFPGVATRGQERAHQLFADVKRLAGMASWPCVLEPGSKNRPIEAGNSLLLRHDGASAPCGTFRVTDADGQRRVVITYNPDHVDDPIELIATFAHELGHYLMSTAKSDPPGGWKLHELHTDIVGVYLGFGIFLANSAHNFSQFHSGGTMGWSSRRQGYLSEGALVTATAIFERLRGADPLEAAPHLKGYLRSDLRMAVKGLKRLCPDMTAAVEAADLSAFG